MWDFAPIALDAQNPGPMTAGGNQTYLLVDESGAATLVDAGVGDPRHLATLDGELVARRAVLTRVLVTHGHSDHASGAPAIAARHPAASFAKFPWPGEDARYDVDWRPLGDGDAVPVGRETLTVVHTPGHCPDHVAFWHESSRTAFTGDLIVGGGSAMIHWSRGGNLAAYLESLHHLAGLRPSRILPAHGTPIENPLEVLARAINHRLMREEQIVDLLSVGPLTVTALTESIYHGRDPVIVGVARETVRAHLEKLKSEQRVSSDGEFWNVRTA